MRQLLAPRPTAPAQPCAQGLEQGGYCSRVTDVIARNARECGLGAAHGVPPPPHCRPTPTAAPAHRGLTLVHLHSLAEHVNKAVKITASIRWCPVLANMLARPVAVASQATRTFFPAAFGWTPQLAVLPIGQRHSRWWKQTIHLLAAAGRAG